MGSMAAKKLPPPTLVDDEAGLCLIRTCEMPARTHGLCAAHYAAERRGKKAHEMGQLRLRTKGRKKVLGAAHQDVLDKIDRAIRNKEAPSRYEMIAKILQEWADNQPTP